LRVSSAVVRGGGGFHLLKRGRGRIHFEKGPPSAKNFKIGEGEKREGVGFHSTGKGKTHGHFLRGGGGEKTFACSCEGGKKKRPE